MRKYVTLILFAALLSGGHAALAQDSEPGPEAQAAGQDAGDPAAAETAGDDEAATDEAAAESDAEEEITDETVEELLEDPALADLDRQTYEEDDDDFVPTEEVPADQAIPSMGLFVSHSRIGLM